eukprot:TRINITY_DN58747_c0_g1_i1.p2 TRINITY_DN58747_c0_g1~~TRINITY_DN58747_c0_g1_i1.p2  ORF type:complete len:130 (+),score=9.39 TRINITY_DN58747_c0_g1_i1:201-590(+)
MFRRFSTAVVRAPPTSAPASMRPLLTSRTLFQQHTALYGPSSGTAGRSPVGNSGSRVKKPSTEPPAGTSESQVTPKSRTTSAVFDERHAQTGRQSAPSAQRIDGLGSRGKQNSNLGSDQMRAGLNKTTS